MNFGATLLSLLPTEAAVPLVSKLLQAEFPHVEPEWITLGATVLVLALQEKFGAK